MFIVKNREYLSKQNGSAYIKPLWILLVKRNLRKIPAHCKPYSKNLFENLVSRREKIHFLPVKQLFNPIIWRKAVPPD